MLYVLEWTVLKMTKYNQMLQLSHKKARCFPRTSFGWMSESLCMFVFYQTKPLTILATLSIIFQKLDISSVAIKMVKTEHEIICNRLSFALDNEQAGFTEFLWGK